MRILVVHESPSWVDHHISGSLKQMGHEVISFVYGTYVGEFYGHSRAGEQVGKNDELLALAKAENAGKGLDLIFCYVYDDFLLPSHASKLAALGIPMVNLNVDMVNQWYRQSRTAKWFTAMLCAQKANMNNLAKYSSKLLYFPMAAPLLTQAQVASTCIPAAAVTFVGTPMPFRQRVLNWLYQQDVPLAVYGKWWRERRQAQPDRNREKLLSDLVHYALPRIQAEGASALWDAFNRRWQQGKAVSTEVAELLPENLLHGFVPEEQMCALFRESPINLGFTRMSGDDPFIKGQNQIKLRDFEIPMAGGFYLVERAPDYEELFEPGKEVETWDSPGELAEKIRYYLDHPRERLRIAEAGARRALLDHSWQKRFTDLFDELGLKG